METQNHPLCSSTVGLEMGGTTGLEQGTGNTLPTHQSDAEIQRAPHSCLTTVSRVATPAHSDMKYLAKCVVMAASEGNKDSKTSVSKHTGDVSKQNPRAQVCTAVRPQQLCVCWALLVLLMVSQRAGVFAGQEALSWFICPSGKPQMFMWGCLQLAGWLIAALGRHWDKPRGFRRVGIEPDIP